MKVSIIVPYKNSSQWLDRCMKSLCNNHGDLEFLLVNDNSTDNSKQIVESYHDDRIISLDNECNPGVSGARNTGIKHATGDYISFLDSDDECVSDIYNSYQFAVKHYDGNIIQFNHWRRYEKTGKIVLKYTNPPGVYNTNNMPKLWEFVTNKLFKKEFIDNNNILFNENMQWGEDELFSLMCIAKDNRIRCFEHPCFIHHFNNHNSLAKSKQADDLLKQVHILEDFLLTQDDPKIRCFICDWISYHWVTDAFQTILGLRDKK